MYTTYLDHFFAVYPFLLHLFLPLHSLQAKIGTLPGDILLISSFLSYVGCFTRRYREELQHKMWLPNFRKIDVSGRVLSLSPS